MADLIGVKRISRMGDRDKNSDSLHSDDEQVESCERHAEANGDRIVRWIDETDSVSGKTLDREGLQGGLKDVYDNQADGIIVMKMSRFGRDAVASVSEIRKLKDAGKVFIAVKDGIDTRNDSIANRIMMWFIATFDEWFLEGVTNGWLDIKTRQVDLGINTTEPYGYRKDQIFDSKGKRIGGTRLLEPVPEEAPWVVQMFEKRKAKVSWQKIADWLNDEGVRTRAGAHWTHNSVNGIVGNRTYLGEVRSGDYVNENAHTALVGQRLWTDANAHDHSNPRAEKVQYPLTGIIRCSACGVKMVGRTNRRKRKDGVETVYRYYDCRRKHGFGKCPAPVRVRADIVEAKIYAVFVERFINPCCEVMAEGVTTGIDLEAAVLVLEDADADLRGFLASPATAELRKELGQSYVDEGMRARLDRVKAARKAVTEAQNAMLGIDLPENLAELWETYGAQERHAFLFDAFAIIAAHPGNVVSFWTVNEPGTPDNLPSRGVEVMEATPIPMRNAPAGPRVAVA